MAHEHKSPLGDAVEIVDILDTLFRFQNAGKGTIFCDFSGHVGQLNVRIYVPVWVADTEPAFDKCVYLDDGEEDLQFFKDELFKFINSI